MNVCRRQVFCRPYVFSFFFNQIVLCSLRMVLLKITNARPTQQLTLTATQSDDEK